MTRFGDDRFLGSTTEYGQRTDCNSQRIAKMSVSYFFSHLY